MDLTRTRQREASPDTLVVGVGQRLDEDGRSEGGIE